MKGLSFKAMGLSDVGRARPNNEDAFFCDAQKGIFIVADGMGGHNAGEVASSLAVDIVQDFLIKKYELGVPHKSKPAKKYKASSPDLILALKAANSLVYERGKGTPKDAGMGTTLVCAFSDGETLAIAHVGDSRAYLFRKGLLSRLTEDHSVVQDQVRQGLISWDEAARSNLQNLLTRAIGSNSEVQVDASEHPLFPEDVILLASDGLTKMLSDKNISDILSQESDPTRSASLLVSAACEAGGLDNVTVIVARAEGKTAKISHWISKLLKK